MRDSAAVTDGDDRGSVAGWSREDLSAAGLKVVLPVEGWGGEESSWKGKVGSVCREAEGWG
jgi:hypothetical protein